MKLQKLTRQGVRDLDSEFGPAKPAGRIVRGTCVEVGDSHVWRRTGKTIPRHSEFDYIADDWLIDPAMEEVKCAVCGITDWRTER